MSRAERLKCSLSSLLPMSCRDKAEAFARHLHTRLRSLGSEDEEATSAGATETSWLGVTADSSAVAVAQPRHVPNDPDLFISFGLLESPDSPQEELGEHELTTLINTTDNLRLNNAINKPNSYSSHDSDSSDGTFYDTETEAQQQQKLPNCYMNGLVSPIQESDTTASNWTTADDEQRNTTTTPTNATIRLDLPSLSTDEDELPSSELSVSHAKRSSSEASELDSSSLSDQEASGSSPVRDLALDGTAESKGNEQKLGKASETARSSSPVRDLALDDVQESKGNEQRLGKASLNERETTRSSSPVQNWKVDNARGWKIKEPRKGKASLNAEEASSGSPVRDIALDATQGKKGKEFSFLEVREHAHDDCEDDVETDERTPRVRRCSSLKTGKTPPGTPSCKKIVRFADVLGLDLADVRTFLDEIPKVPTSAYEDLTDADPDLRTDPIEVKVQEQDEVRKREKLLMPLFQQPGGLPNFLDRVRERNVCLENATVEDSVDLAIVGTVRVRNLDFNKSVHIRYSLDAWKTYADLQATYSPNTCDGFSDKFTFLLYAHTVAVGQRVEFAVRFQCRGAQYWDNNMGANYGFQCLPASHTSTYHCDDHWGASFY